MTTKTRRKSDKGKTKIALEAVRGQATLTELAQRYEVHSDQIYASKKQLVEHRHPGGAGGPVAPGVATHSLRTDPARRPGQEGVPQDQAADHRPRAGCGSAA